MKSSKLLLVILLVKVMSMLTTSTVFATDVKTSPPESFKLTLPTASTGEFPVGMSLSADFTPFAPDSPWNTPIPLDAALHPDSSAMIEMLEQRAAILKADMDKWSVPLFVINADTSPKRTVYATTEPLHPSVDPDGNQTAEGIPIPKGVWPDSMADGHMLLVDPVKRMSWDFSRAKLLENGSWQASRVAVWDLNGPGYGPAFSGKRWWMHGARGSGMPLIGGLIRPEELESGEIRHALAFAAPSVRKASSYGGPVELCSPMASRTDGVNTGLAFIPEGARIQLDPNLDLDLLGLSQPTRILARAMQIYGMYLSDQGETFKIYLQNLGPDGEAWQNIGDFQDLSLIPIHRFRVLDCVTITKS